MPVSPILPLALPLQPIAASHSQPSAAGSFEGFLDKALNELNAAQVKAEQLTLQLVTGEIQDLHQVTVAMTEAKVLMQLAIEVRNKAVEAYQEISRMQI